jgi:hypothetical protein
MYRGGREAHRREVLDAGEPETQEVPEEEVADQERVNRPRCCGASLFEDVPQPALTALAFFT